MMTFQVVFAIALAALAAFLARLALARFALARRVQKTPLSAVGALRDGAASIRARVDDDARRLESPLTRRPCVYYRLELKEKQVRLVRREGRLVPESAWRPVLKDERYAPCSLSDDTGAVTLDLRQAQKRVRPSASLRVDAFRPPPFWLETLLEARYGYSLRGFFLPKTIQLEEQALFVGDEVYALGVAAVQGGERRLRAGDEMPLLVSDGGPSRLAWALRLEGGGWALGAGILLAIAGAIVVA